MDVMKLPFLRKCDDEVAFRRKDDEDPRRVSSGYSSAVPFIHHPRA